MRILPSRRVVGARPSINNGLVSVWKFDSTGNDAVGGNTMTLSGGASYTGGMSGNCLLCASGTQLAQNAGPSGLDPGTGNFSYWFWVNPITLNASVFFWRKWNGSGAAGAGNSGWATRMSGGGAISLVLHDGVAQTEWFSSNVMTASAWHFAGISVTRSGNARLYLDGTSTLVDVTARSGSIGAAVPLTAAWSGGVLALDEVGYLNRAATLAEFDYLYNAGAGKFYPYA